MSKKLLIVESPTKARTISHYLGKDYTVLASIGHVRDLPKSNTDAVDIEGGFIPRYVMSADKREVIEKIRHAAAKADEIYLATDPDREGEAIAWHIAQIIRDDLGSTKHEARSTKPIKRVVYHEITKEAVEEALAHPRAIDENLRRAQEARRVLDRIVGYDLSGLIWKKVRYGLSAGRVQSPALRILAEREREIKAFMPVTYFVLNALFKSRTADLEAEPPSGGSASKSELQTTFTEQPSTKEEAERIVQAGRSARWGVADISEKAEERNPRPPFTTSTLQQAASTRLGFAPSRTMRAAQKLYEAGYITYMRTDSVNLAKEAVAKMAGVVETQFGKEYLKVRVYKTTSKNAQEAHEAIRPTDPSHARAGVTPDEVQLYELIRTRALASQMASARIMRTSVSVKAANGASIPLFSASGSRMLFPGWLALDTTARGEDVELPHLSVGDVLTLLSLSSLEKQTEPPNRYTEAGLIKELEKRGIGRPSTYASIMKTIQDRGYVEKLARALKPTATGMVVSGWLEEHFPTYVSDTFTAEMEDELDEIARGERGYTETLSAFYGPFEKAVHAKDKLPKATSLGDTVAEFPCPLCGSAMEFKLGRGGVFMSCKKYPECLGARTEDGHELKGDEPIGVHPDTGVPIYVKTGRFGPYVEMTLEAGDWKLETGKKKTRGRPKTAAKRASIPKGTDLSQVTLADAVKYLSLPRELGNHPSTGKAVFSNTGRFGPYVGSDGEFRSIKKSPSNGLRASDPYTITLDEALDLLSVPKKPPKGVEVVKELGKHPRTGKSLVLYKSKQGLFLKKGLRRIYLPDSVSADSLSPATAAEYLK
ncbi:DNA topoisomerase I [Candidatus Kaiserbacteria bacterium RIFCSPHIGHO2_02_FULL_55_17]|uniref:DNA topoisomerase 1 n=1 Tax=Candidatus Kaiserbacteria bacterium RIFCSPHIGHO2_02_FULL_55_17 TaxID=1798496 RepID=A0A1F6DRV9_9BACT|nr:MAG: DNA topoisomerase I [Candidatus Kaiserbacteria bacterium RIFCSPHIGHO2_02_FULL_55_17]